MNPESIIILNKKGEFLGSRELGSEIRYEINTQLSSSLNVIINFEGIKGVSHSFTDELIGKLIDELSVDEFKKRIKFQNAIPEIVPILRYVINNHLQSV